ncbi:MAG: ABC transporter permease [Bryobacteraceae bacterium]
MNFRRTRAVALKEFRHIVRDVRSLILALALPVVMLIMFGTALSLDVDRIPTVVYDADNSSASRLLVERFAGSRFFTVMGHVSSYQEIERLIDRNRIILGVVVPRDYSKHLRSGADAQVQLLLDGSDSNTASIALSYAEALVRAYSFEIRRDAQNRRGVITNLRGAAPIDTRLRVWYNSELQSKNYIVPGLTAVILMIIASLLTSLTIAREWEQGTMEQLLSTPLRPAEIVLGKMAAHFCVGTVDTFITLVLGAWFFEVPFRGSVLVVAASSFVFLFGALFWGIFLSAVTRSQTLAFQAGLISSFLPSFLLSGFVYAIESMPLGPRLISHITPARYFITILKGAFLKGVGFEVLWADFLFLVAFGGLVFFLATRKMRQKLA